MASNFSNFLSHLDLLKPRIIGIDGLLGAGKTTLSKIIAAKNHYECLHLDDYITPGQGNFLESIQIEKLQTDVAKCNNILIIEGICLLAVLDKLSMNLDFFIFVEQSMHDTSLKSSDVLKDEVSRYTTEYSPKSKANVIFALEPCKMSLSQYDVDVAYIKSKTITSVALSIGGLFQSVVGLFVLNAGLNSAGTANIKVMGSEISSTGLGSIVLCTSVLWAYFAYLARPIYRTHSESHNTRHADGSTEVYEYRTSTQIRADPIGNNHGSERHRNRKISHE